MHLKNGDQIHIEGRLYTIDDIRNVQDALIRDNQTGYLYPYNLVNQVKQLGEPGANSNVNIFNLDDKLFEQARWKMDIIRDLVSNPGPSNRTEVVRKKAAEAGRSFRTIQEWVSDFREAERNGLEGFEGLYRSSYFGGKGQKRVEKRDSRIEEIFNRMLPEYLDLKKPNAAKFYRDFCSVLHHEGIENPLAVTSYSWCMRRLQAVDPRIVTRFRDGPKAYNQKYRVSKDHFPDGSWPLQSVQIDHHQLDVLVRDEESDETFRPYLTLGKDVFSRIVWGFHIGIAHPSADTLALVTRMGSLRKDEILRDFGIRYDWPVYGIPGGFHSDNGMDFLSKQFVLACSKYNIRLPRRRTYTPRDGGGIERVFGTFEEQFFHCLDGTTNSNPSLRGEYNSSANASISLKELTKLFLDYMLGVYHHARHRILKVSPYEKFVLGVQGLNDANCVISLHEPKNLERFRRDFLPFVDGDGRRVIEDDGCIHFGSRIYWSRELDYLPRRESGNKGKKIRYVVKHDPFDVAQITLIDNENNYIDARLQSEPDNVTERQYNEIKQKFKKQGLDPTEPDIFRAIYDLREQITPQKQTKRELKAIAGEKWELSVRKQQSQRVVTAKPDSDPNDEQYEYQSTEQQVENSDDDTWIEKLDPNSIDITKFRKEQ